MKRLFALLAFAIPAFSQAPPPAPDSRDAFGGHGGYFKYNPVLTALDTNHDFILSAEEIAHCVPILKSFDRNGDGKLTAEEILPNIPLSVSTATPPAETMAASLLAFDKNHDGKLTRDELPARMQNLFDRGDTNHDGFLTRDEIDKLEASLAPPKGDVQRERPAPQGGFIRQDPMLIALDVNHDGEISTEEMENAPTVLLRLDANKDGQLSEDELRPRPMRMTMDQMLTNLIKQYDKNGDGKLSRDEMPERMHALFDRTDIDRDGFITFAELQAIVKREGGLYAGPTGPPAQNPPAKK
jgi:Ca2+-binding EF-hand superfamily protein